MKMIFSLLTAVSLLTLTGCDSGASAAKASGGVALIDLEVVAKRLGRDTEIDGALKSIGTDLEAKLAATQKDLQDEFQQLKKSLGENLTQAQNQKLADRGRELNEKFQQAQQAAREEVASKRTELVVRFREEIRPTALHIASARGLATVLVKSDIVVLANDPSVDITDEVVAELVSKPSPSAETPASGSN